MGLQTVSRREREVLLRKPPVARSFFYRLLHPIRAFREARAREEADWRSALFCLISDPKAEQSVELERLARQRSVLRRVMRADIFSSRCERDTKAAHLWAAGELLERGRLDEKFCFQIAERAIQESNAGLVRMADACSPK